MKGISESVVESGGLVSFRVTKSFYRKAIDIRFCVDSKRMFG